MPQYKEIGLTHGSFKGFGPSGYHSVAYSLRGKGNDEATQRPPVLCVHGILENRHFFDPLARVLSKGTAVWCPDMPGHGDSDSLPRGTDYSWELFRDDLNILIGRMAAPCVDFIGVSMGGLLGLHLASLPGTPIRRLVLVDVGPVVENDRTDALGEKLAKPLVFDDEAQVVRHLKRVFCGFAPMLDADWAQMARDTMRPTKDGRLRLAYDAQMRHAFSKGLRPRDMWDDFARISAEILVVRGGHSTVLSAKQVEDMRNCHPGLQEHVVPEAGHVPALHDAAQIDAVRAFLGLEGGLAVQKRPGPLTREEKDFFNAPFPETTFGP